MYATAAHTPSQKPVSVPTLRRMKQDRVPIVALTANAFEEDRRHALDVGMDDFLAKPTRLEALRETLAQRLPGAASSHESSGIDPSSVSVQR